MKNKRKTVRYILIALCELLTAVNVIRFIAMGQYNRLLLALLTLVLILVPEGIERFLHYRISDPASR